MATSHFERLIEEARTELLKAHIAVSAGDSHRHAQLKGQYEGLQKALEIYRQAHRPSEDEDGI